MSRSFVEIYLGHDGSDVTIDLLKQQECFVFQFVISLCRRHSYTFHIVLQLFMVDETKETE